MNVIKTIIKLLIILGASSYFRLNPKALNEVIVTKDKIPYEILSIKMINNSIEIKGWVFISYTQHYLNDSDHKTELEFLSINDSFKVIATTQSISMTNQMQYFGTPKCGPNIINKAPEICNFSYENVGFKVNIPMDMFKVNETYQTNIISHAYKSNLSYKTPVYFPLINDITFNYSDKIYTVKSKLDDTEIKVSATTVIARTQPLKTSPVWFYGDSCSTTYKNQLFFLKNSIYKNVLERKISENINYYRVKANITQCDGDRRRIIEGTIISPIWIASTYVQYSGTPLEISSKYINRAPYFEYSEINLYKGQSFELLDYVKAIDPEEGDISHKITIRSSNYKDELGTYTLNLEVFDKEGLKANATILVNVLALMNNSPVIFLDNIRILQNTIFNPLDYANAYDNEDGDITDKIISLNTIDTSIISIQEVCYYVEDSKGLNNTKCINVEIYSNQLEYLKFRSISKNNLFYGEDIPNNWKDIIYIIDILLNKSE